MPGYKTLGTALALACLLASGHALAQQKKPPLAMEGFTEDKHKSCIACHRSDPVKDIFHTRHANKDNPDTPAAKEQCESCHGPSAAHANFPLQVKNFRFGKRSDKTAAQQNEICLKCHADDKAKNWQDDMHDETSLMCGSCHSVHKREDPLLNQALTAYICVQCHEKVRAEQHIVGLHIIESGTVSCTNCHDPHAKRGTILCANCHEQDAATLAAQSAKAQEFHATTQANNLPCMKCHRGVAHGVPKWVEEMSKQQQQQR
jgi:predicted CXXCH cytochrome family protein